MCWAQCLRGSGRLGVAHARLMALQVCTYTGLRFASYKLYHLASASNFSGNLSRLPAGCALCAAFAVQCAPSLIAFIPNSSKYHSSCGCLSSLHCLDAWGAMWSLCVLLGKWEIGFSYWDNVCPRSAGGVFLG